MLYFNFKNYQEFQELFGIVEHGNGTKSRKNKILLSLLKSKELLHLEASRVTKYQKTHYWAINPKTDKEIRYFRWKGQSEDNMGQLLSICSLTGLRHTLYGMMRRNGEYWLSLNGNEFRSDFYETDDFKGLCEDGDERSIRYRNIERDRIFKMRAGKFFRKLIDEKDFATLLPEAIKIWLAEEFAEEWKAYASQFSNDNYELHVDDNFSDIYDSNCLVGNFGSCMTDNGQYSYYEDSVTAKAAYLTDEDGMIVARCIVFPEVHVYGTDKVLRLAERQYATDGSDKLKHQLVMALINAGEIDGYKRVGAGCSDNTAFVDVNGNPLESTDLWISCSLENGDTLSYQDSFRWYDIDNGKAYNCSNHPYDEDLATTSSEFNQGEWSNYNDEYIPSDDAYYVETRDDVFWGNQVVDAEHLCGGRYYTETCFIEDCIEIGNTYYYAGHDAECPEDYGLCRCEKCDEWFVEGEGYYSEITEEYYCCDYCRRQAEEDWKEDNWTYSKYDDEYFKDDVVTALEWSFLFNKYRETTIHVDTFESLCDDEEAVIFEGERYIDAIGIDGEPAHIVAAEFCAA